MYTATRQREKISYQKRITAHETEAVVIEERRFTKDEKERDEAASIDV